MSSSKGKVVWVRVLNWEKYNPRKDVKNSTWFRMDHAFLDREDVGDFTHSELVTLWYIWSACSKGSKALTPIFYERARRVRGLTSKQIDSAIDKLVRNQMLEVVPRDVADTRTCSTNERDETNETDERTRRDGRGAPCEEQDAEFKAKLRAIQERAIASQFRKAGGAA